MSKDTTKDTDNPNLNSSNEANTASKSQDSVTFALAQSHFLVGDITANAEKMRALSHSCRAHQEPVAHARRKPGVCCPLSC